MLKYVTLGSKRIPRPGNKSVFIDKNLQSENVTGDEPTVPILGASGKCETKINCLYS